MLVLLILGLSITVTDSALKNDSCEYCDRQRMINIKKPNMFQDTNKL